MMDKTTFRAGLKRSTRFVGAPAFRAALLDGPDVSWLHLARYGDDQGKHGACTVFALANWAELVGRAFPEGMASGERRIAGSAGNITNEACLAAYYASTGGVDEGTSFEQGWQAASAAGWIVGAHGLRMEFDLDRLPRQPILGGYEITEDWIRDGNIDEGGRFRSLKSVKSLGYHAVLILGGGVLPAWGAGRWIYVLTPWRQDNGAPWGWNGVVALPATYHDEWIREMWSVY
jgi:hypothetical protein